MRLPSDNEFVINLAQEVYSEAFELFQESLVNVILFGSYARGDYDEYSDVDFMLVVNLPSGRLAAYRKEMAKISSKLSLKYDRTVSLHLQDNDTVSLYGDVLPYLKNAMEEGICAHAG